MNAEKLESFVKKLEALSGGGDVDMSCGSNLCGSPGCHAGWAGVAILGEGAYVNFRHNSTVLAQYLGFLDARKLKIWAYDNPTLWGNRHGIGMFWNSAAFDQTDTVFSLSVIIEHWRKVHERMVAMG